MKIVEQVQKLQDRAIKCKGGRVERHAPPLTAQPLEEVEITDAITPLVVTHVFPEIPNRPGWRSSKTWPGIAFLIIPE